MALISSPLLYTVLAAVTLVDGGSEQSPVRVTKAGSHVHGTMGKPSDADLANHLVKEDHLTKLLIGDCSKLTSWGLQHIGNLKSLQLLTLVGVPVSIIYYKNEWIRKLPAALRTLEIMRPGYPLTRLLMVRNGASVFIRHLENAILAALPKLWPNLWRLYIADCPRITAAGLWNIGKLTKLRNLEMKGLSFDSINAVVLARLHYCTKLRVLELGDSRSKPIDTIPPEHIVRLVKAVKLWMLYINIGEEASQIVLDGIVKAKLGRYITVHVPAKTFNKMTNPKRDTRVQLQLW